MKFLLVSWVLIASAVVGATQPVSYVYEGPWKTTNRKLDGTMTCVVTSLGKEKWQARFYGRWQGVDFDYPVDFQGKADDLHGTATIDGAAYEWRGVITAQSFKANFGGDRYRGSFDLTRKIQAPAKSSTTNRQHSAPHAQSVGAVAK